MNERKIGILASYVNIFVQVVIGFLYVPILLHYIGKNEYGLYQLIGSLIAYFGIMDFGLTGAITRFYARYRALQDRERMENLLAVSLRLYGAVAGLMLMAGGICYMFLDAIFGASMTGRELVSAKQLFLLLLFNVAVTLLTMLFRAVINADERFLFLKGTELLQLIIQPVLVIGVLQEYPYALSVALVQTVLNCMLNLARIYYCFACLHISIRFHGWDWDLLRDFRKLALSLFAVSLIDQVFFKTNQVILGIVSDTAAVAVYSIAALIYMNYMALSTAISGVYLPHVTAMIAKKTPVQGLSALFIRIGRVQYFLLLLVLTGFIIFGRQFISLWAGVDFLPAYEMTLVIIIPFTIDLIQNVGLSIMMALNQYDFRAKVYLGMGIMNLALGIPLAIQYGGIGCAFATGLCMFIGNGLIMNWYYAKVVGLALSAFWKQIGNITIVGIIYLCCGIWLQRQIGNDSIMALVGEILLYILGYAGVMWRFAMNTNEKYMIRKMLMGGAELRIVERVVCHSLLAYKNLIWEKLSVFPFVFGQVSHCV